MKTIREQISERMSKNVMLINWGAKSYVDKAIKENIMLEEILKLKDDEILKIASERSSYYEDLKDDNFGTLKGRDFESLYIFYDDIKEMF